MTHVKTCFFKACLARNKNWWCSNMNAFSVFQFVRPNLWHLFASFSFSHSHELLECHSRWLQFDWGRSLTSEWQCFVLVGPCFILPICQSLPGRVWVSNLHSSNTAKTITPNCKIRLQWPSNLADSGESRTMLGASITHIMLAAMLAHTLDCRSSTGAASFWQRVTNKNVAVDVLRIERLVVVRHGWI